MEPLLMRKKKDDTPDVAVITLEGHVQMEGGGFRATEHGSRR